MKWQMPACVSITPDQVRAEESNELRTLNLVVGGKRRRLRSRRSVFAEAPERRYARGA
jgi:hypothetical protein